MADFFDLSSTVAEKAKSPLANFLVPGKYPAFDGATNVKLSELAGQTICEVAAWPDGVEAVRALLPSEGTVFEFAPARWVIVCADVKPTKKLALGVGDHGSFVDLSHGRCVLRVKGKKSAWVLSKLFAIDFAAMDIKTGVATTHHGITAQIWRDDSSTFDLVIFRSFAASFWHTLTKACADVGYEAV
ncbi:MAG: sarcosine oxidase subunit gamma family protein [Pseudomonadota bacterium]